MAVDERCPDTGLYVGYIPGFPGAHTQAESLDELNRNLQEVHGLFTALAENELNAHEITEVARNVE